MKKLYLFNPDHDLALANFDPNYMPSANVRQLATDLAMLPVWYAGGNDLVMAPSAFNQAYLDKLKGMFPALPDLSTVVNDNDNAGMIASPWGWNPAVRKRFSLAGVSDALLPTQEKLQQIRRHSDRQLAVNVLPKLLTDNDMCGESRYFTRPDEIRKFVESHRVSVLKAPLSGSGKGLNWCKGQYTYHIEHWCLNVLKQQGGVVAEPVYDKTVDFAMQFYIDDTGNMTFAGYSLFQTNASGAYVGNVLASNRDIENDLSKYVPLDKLEAVKQTLIAELGPVLKGIHTGYFGVDMMICRFGDKPFYRIHPCVEINLRMSMGMVSRLIYDRYVHENARGIYRIDYYQTPEALKQAVGLLERKNPVQMSEGRLVKGFLSLVPVTNQSHYHAWIQL